MFLKLVAFAENCKPTYKAAHCFVFGLTLILQVNLWHSLSMSYVVDMLMLLLWCQQTLLIPAKTEENVVNYPVFVTEMWLFDSADWHRNQWGACGATHEAWRQWRGLFCPGDGAAQCEFYDENKKDFYVEFLLNWSCLLADQLLR